MAWLCHQSCPLTWMLIASHIKPWRDADNQERLDTYNGLLLLPNYDKLFDLGYISFNPKGKIMCSRLLDKFDREAIGLTSDLHLVKLENQHLKYLKYHTKKSFYCGVPIAHPAFLSFLYFSRIL